MIYKILRKGFYLLVCLLLTTTCLPISLSEINGNQKYLYLDESNNTQFLDNLFLDKLLNQLMNFGHIPSLSACIIKKDRVLWYNSYGYADIENNVFSSINSSYLVASVSKVVTATAIMQLFERGFFDLCDDVNNYLDFKIFNPYYPNSIITFEMLLSHTSSLNTETMSFYQVFYNQDPLCLDSWLKDYFFNNESYLRNRWYEEIPGTNFHYSNLGFTILGRLVEIISNKSFNDYCKENIFEPLDMKSSSFILSDLEDVVKARPYMVAFKKKFNEPYDFYIPFPQYTVRFYPAGALRTSVEDLSHFFIAHMNNGIYKNVRILNESTINLMHTIHIIINNKNSGYGFGWGNSIKPFGLSIEGHSGSLYGFNSFMYYRKYDNVGVIFIVNRELSIDYEGKISYYIIQHLLFLKARYISSMLTCN